MSKIPFKTIAEFVGLASIVASLLFVGMEIRQSRVIATTQNIMTSNTNQIEILNAINDHAEIWIRGNEGGELTPADREIYNNLLQNSLSWYFYSWQQDSRLNGTPVDEFVPLRQLIYFLAENPGAYAAWIEITRTGEKARSPLRDGNESARANPFNDFIRDQVAEWHRMGMN